MTRKDLITKCEDFIAENSKISYKNICTPESPEKCDGPCGGNLKEDECNDNIFCKYENGKCKPMHNSFEDTCKNYPHLHCEVVDAECREKEKSHSIDLTILVWLIFDLVIFLFYISESSNEGKGPNLKWLTSNGGVKIITIAIIFIIPSLVLIFKEEIKTGGIERWKILEATTDFIIIAYIFVLFTHTASTTKKVGLSIYILLSWFIKKFINKGGPWNSRTAYYNSFHPFIIFKLAGIDSILDTEVLDDDQVENKCLLPAVPNSDSNIPQTLNLGDTYQIRCNDTFNGGGIFTCLNQERYEIKFPDDTWKEDNNLHTHRLIDGNGASLIFKNNLKGDNEDDSLCINNYRQHKCSAKKNDSEICIKGDTCSTIKDKNKCIEQGCNFRETVNPYCPTASLNVCENASGVAMGDICTEDSDFPHIPTSPGSWFLTIFIHIVIILFFWKIIKPKVKGSLGWLIFAYIGQPIIFLLLITSSHLGSLWILDDSACPDKIETCKAVKQPSLSNCNAIDGLCTYDGTNCVPKCGVNPFAVLSEVLLGNNKKWEDSLIFKKIWTISTAITPWILIAFIIARWIIKENKFNRIIVMLFWVILLIPFFVFVETSTSNICIKRLANTYAKTPSEWTCWLSAFGGWVPLVISWIIIIIIIIFGSNKN